MDTMKKMSQDDHRFRKKKLITCLNIFFILTFTLIIISIVSVFLAIKQQAQSESLSSSDPDHIIQTICDLTSFPAKCFHPISALYAAANNSEPPVFTPSTVFALSLKTASDQLNRPGNPCGAPARFLEKSMAVMRSAPPDRGGDMEEAMRRDLEGWISSAVERIDRCLGVYKQRKKMMTMMAESREYVVICSEILARMEYIRGMFEAPAVFPSIEESRAFLLGSLESGYAGFFPIIAYCWQYLFLIAFICIVLKL